jgi:predicted dehydrogenase
VSLRPGLRVAIAGCGLIGNKRAGALGPDDRLIGAFDTSRERSHALAGDYGGRACTTFEELLGLDPDVVIVAVIHEHLAELTERALACGAHVLVEKPGGIGRHQIESLLSAAAAANRRVKVGFNHRFHPAIAQLAQEVHSGAHGELMHLRARYGHGGRLGYDREWRADPRHSGGGELVDQGMHLLDLSHWLAGPLPFHGALLRTHFWDTQVEDNAALILGEHDSRQGPWALLHVSWTEWKNTFSLEVYCRTAKLQVDGLVRSYGTQRLVLYRMKPALGPPGIERHDFSPEDVSWSREWEHFAEAIDSGQPLLGDLDAALYAWSRVEDAYAANPGYAALRTTATQ